MPRPRTRKTRTDAKKPKPDSKRWLATVTCRGQEYELETLRTAPQSAELMAVQPLPAAAGAQYGVRFEAQVQIFARRPPYVAWLQRRELSGFREYRVVLLADGRTPPESEWQSIRLRAVKLQ